jgi:putative Holliday junction resolvase
MAAVLALDIGEKRIGVAAASLDTRLATPLVTLNNDDQLVAGLQALCAERGVTQLVAGLPRGLDGQETAQTRYAQSLGDQLAAYILEDYLANLPTVTEA